MIKIHHSFFARSILYALIVFCSMPLLADDLEDARNAYGAGEFEEAATLLEPLVKQQDMDAVFLLARMYEKGDGVRKNINEAKRLFRLAAKNGNSAAQQKLDVFDAQGADDSVVIDWYLPAANEGDTEAQYNLGFMYETGWGVRVNEKNAFRWYQEAAEMQHDVAQLRLALMYIVGVAGNQSLDNGLSLLRRSAENGNRIAEALVQDLFDAEDVSLSSSIRIVAGIRRVIDEGESETLRSLTRSLELLHKNRKRKFVRKTPTLPSTKREFVKKLVVKPTPLVKNTSEIQTSKTKTQNKDIQKNKIAAKNVTAIDSRTPIKKPEPQIKQKIATAQIIDTPKSTKKAERRPTLTNSSNKIVKEITPPRGSLFNWYLKRANQGEADSQFQLGAMYIKGQQVGKDIEEGVHWIELSAKQGYHLAEIYMNLWGDKIESSSVAVSWLMGAGRNFDIEAIFNLAFIYETGRGVELNTRLSKQWYKLAAAEGHVEAKKRFSAIKVTNADVQLNGVSRDLRTKLSLPLLLGILLIFSIAALGFMFFRRSNDDSVSIPPLDSMAANKLSRDDQSSRAIPIEDRAFIDELWSPSKASSFVEPALEIPIMEAKSDVKEAPQAPAISDNNESVELSAVDKKLADAVEMLMKMKSGENKTDNVSEKSPASSPETNVEVIKTKEDHQDVEKTDQKDEQKIKNKVIDNFKFNSEFAADSFLSEDISIREVSDNRISAESFFADGISIEEAVETIDRKRKDASKLSADDMLNTKHVSSGKARKVDSRSKTQKKNKTKPKMATPRKKVNELANFGESVIPTLEKKIRTEEKNKTKNRNEVADVAEPVKMGVKNEGRALSEVHFNIGVMFSSGDGVPQNDAQAAKWFLKAAEEDMPAAQFNIGRCYLIGAGVQKNTAIAMDWIQKSADNHYKPAMDELQKKNRAS